MPQPSLESVGSLNRPLTEISIAEVQEAEAFGATQMMRDVPVAKKSAKYRTYAPGFFHRSEVQKVAPGGRYPRSGYELSSDSYSCDVQGVEMPIPDQSRENEDETGDLDRDAAIWGTHQMLLRREKDFLNSYFTTGVWTGGTGVGGAGTTPATKWNASSSTPLENIRAELTSMQVKSGRRGNVVGMPRPVWDVLVDHPQLVGRLGNDERKFVQRAFVAALLEVEDVVVFDAIENTAAEGAADVNAFIAGTDDVLILYRPRSPSQLTPAALYNFVWSGFSGAGPAGNRVMTYRDEVVESDIIRTQFAYDQKLVAPDMGVLLPDVLT